MHHMMRIQPAFMAATGKPAVPVPGLQRPSQSRLHQAVLAAQIQGWPRPASRSVLRVCRRYLKRVRGPQKGHPPLTLVTRPISRRGSPWRARGSHMCDPYSWTRIRRHFRLMLTYAEGARHGEPAAGHSGADGLRGAPFAPPTAPARWSSRYRKKCS